jgi:hypothetical protein
MTVITTARYLIQAMALSGGSRMLAWRVVPYVATPTGER